MGQTAKRRTTTVTVDLGELKVSWQAGVRPTASPRAMPSGTPFGRLWAGEPRGFLRLGCASRRSLNEPLPAWK